MSNHRWSPNDIEWDVIGMIIMIPVFIGIVVGILLLIGWALTSAKLFGFG